MCVIFVTHFMKPSPYLSPHNLLVWQVKISFFQFDFDPFFPSLTGWKVTLKLYVTFIFTRLVTFMSMLHWLCSTESISNMIMVYCIVINSIVNTTGLKMSLAAHKCVQSYLRNVMFQILYKLFFSFNTRREKSFSEWLPCSAINYVNYINIKDFSVSSVYSLPFWMPFNSDTNLSCFDSFFWQVWYSVMSIYLISL